MICSRWPQVRFEPWKLQQGLSLCTWGAHSTYWADQCPILLLFYLHCSSDKNIDTFKLKLKFDLKSKCSNFSWFWALPRPRGFKSWVLSWPWDNGWQIQVKSYYNSHRLISNTVCWSTERHRESSVHVLYVRIRQKIHTLCKQLPAILTERYNFNMTEITVRHCQRDLNWAL